MSVCAYCRKVRNGKGCWEPIEAYVANNSHAQFTHEVCPECMARVETEICSLHGALPAVKKIKKGVLTKVLTVLGMVFGALLSRAI